MYAPGFNKAVEIESILKSPHLPGTAEFVVHPSTCVLPGLFGSLTESRVQEWRSLSDPQLVARLKRGNVQLSSFRALSPPASRLQAGPDHGPRYSRKVEHVA